MPCCRTRGLCPVCYVSGCGSKSSSGQLSSGSGIGSVSSSNSVSHSASSTV